MTDEQVLISETDGAVLVLRLNRPDARNALDPDLIGAFGAAILHAESDASVRAVVLTGTGDRAFSAGLDLRAFASGFGDLTDEQRTGFEVFQRFTRGDVAVPVVAAVNAAALAGGFEMVMGCDLVVASTDAKFGLPEVKRGLFAAAGGTDLATRVPMVAALELALTGDPIDATRALEVGLVNRVVEPNEVLDVGIELAQRIARNGPLGLLATKRLMRAMLTDQDTARGELAEWQAKVFSSADAKEGATAFIEKRDPVWSGE